MNDSKPKRPWISSVLWGLSAALALLLALKFFVADVYFISSGSMRPTLFGGSSRDESAEFGEWTLVRYGDGFGLERFDLVALDRAGQPSIVKRVLGLPGESIRIVDGDVFIDGERLARDAQRPEPVLVFDGDRHSVSDMHGIGFCVEESPRGPWHEEAGVWHLQGAEIGLGRDTGRSTGMMLYRPDVRDGYVDQTGKRVAGYRSVNDVIIQFDVVIDLLKDRLRLQLSEAGDLFEARIRNLEGSDASHVIELIRSRRGSAEDSEEVVEASLELDLPLGEWLQLRFSNIDNHVTLTCPQLGLDLFFSYAANQRYPGKPAVGDQNVGVRAGFGGEGIEARFRSIKVLRDLHYTNLPQPEVHPAGSATKRTEELVFLGPEEIFLLGDNSSESTDSRQHGPYSILKVVGRPVSVVWPLNRMRWL